MALDETSDSTLVANVLSGQHEAFRGLVERYHATVRMVALAKTGNVADADDVAQETFLKAYQALGVLRDHGKLAHWLVTIARNSAVSLVRKRERERRHTPQRCEAVVYPDPAYRERLEAVARQVEALPVNLREVVLLHYFEGLKCREIAERLDLRTDAVLKRLSRGREVLGDRLLREWGEGAREDKVSVQRVMGAIVALPQPDWQGQAARISASSIGGEGGSRTLVRLGNVALRPTHVVQGGMVLAAVCLAVYSIAGRPWTGSRADAPLAHAAPGPTELVPNAAGGVETGETDRQLWFAAPSVVESPVPMVAPPPPREVGFISGTVYDQDGRPLQDVRVSVSSLLAGSGVHGSANSNPNGEFRINVLSRADLRLDRLRDEHFEVECYKTGYGPLYRTVGLDESHLRMVLKTAASVGITVVDARTNAPIETIAWRVTRPDRADTSSGVGPRMIITDWREVRSRTGEFTVTDVHGITSISVLSDGYAGATVPVDVPLGASASGIVIALEAGASIEGVVVDAESEAPIPGAGVSVGGDTSQAFRRMSTKTDENGWFSFRDLPASVPFTLSAGGMSYGHTTRTIQPGESNAFIRIYLGRGAALSGVVRFEGAAPPKISEGRYGVVNVRGASEGASSFGFGDIQPDGSYVVRGLNDGWYTVDAWIAPPKHRYGVTAMSQLVQVRDGKDTVANIDFDKTGGGLELTLDGMPEEGLVRFELVSTEVPEVTVSKQTISASSRLDDGRAVLIYGGLPRGVYLLRAVDPGQDGAVLLEEEVSIPADHREALTVHWVDLAGVDEGVDGGG